MKDAKLGTFHVDFHEINFCIRDDGIHRHLLDHLPPRFVSFPMIGCITKPAAAWHIYIDKKIDKSILGSQCYFVDMNLALTAVFAP